MMAGIGEMNPGTFFAYNVLGAALWAAGVTLAGFGLGKTIPNVDKYLLPIIGLIILISLIPPLLEYRKHKKGQTDEHTLDDAEAGELADGPPQRRRRVARQLTALEPVAHPGLGDEVPRSCRARARACAGPGP